MGRARLWALLAPRPPRRSPANRAISNWIKREAYRRIDLNVAVISAFDHLYTSPLLRLRAFWRSAAISTIVFSLWSVETNSSLWYIYNVLTTRNGAILGAIMCLSFVIFSDYISLFAIRFLITHLGKTPMPLLPISLAIAVVVISTVFIFSVGLLSFIAWITNGHPRFIDFHPTVTLERIFDFGVHNPKSLVIFEPALFVNSWILLFACGAGLLRLCYPFFKAVSWAQWFLKAGGQHPFRAIGMVAAALTFILVAGFKAFWWGA